MRAVRCDVCGAKAMMAAAQCPKCGHLFELRDGFGTLLPLAYCSGCDSYYPESLGQCRWCGTKPERAPIGPQLWKAVGAALLVVMVVAAWLLRNHESPETRYIQMKTARSQPAPRANKEANKEVSRDSSARTVLAADTALARAIMMAAEPTSPAPGGSATADSATATSADVSQNAAQSPADSSTPPAGPVVIPQGARAYNPTGTAVAGSFDARPAVGSPSRTFAATTSPAPVSKSKRRPTLHWVSSVARDWVIVRSDASKHSRIIVSIGPNSHVQLGESRGTWRRIRAKGFSGWVEQGSAFVVVAAR